MTHQGDDKPAAEYVLGDMRCSPLEALADLINHRKEREIALNEVDFVSTGAATVPQPFEKDSKVVADFGELGRIYLNFS